MSKFDEIIMGNELVLVDFFATWCGPCRMQAGILEQLKAELGDSVTILKVDVDKNEELAAKARVQSIPTLILFRHGEPVWRAMGVQSLETLKQALLTK
ncbi:MAG: thioredoxin [Muribaculaceae bacterium]